MWVRAAHLLKSKSNVIHYGPVFLWFNLFQSSMDERQVVSRCIYEAWMIQTILVNDEIRCSFTAYLFIIYMSSSPFSFPFVYFIRRVRKFSLVYCCCCGIFLFLFIFVFYSLILFGCRLFVFHVCSFVDLLKQQQWSLCAFLHHNSYAYAHSQTFSNRCYFPRTSKLILFN